MRKALLRFPVPASKNGCGSQMICKLQYELAPSCAPYPNLGASNNDAGYNVRCSAHVLYLEKSEMFVLLSFHAFHAYCLSNFLNDFRLTFTHEAK